jgi:hypothetical protein
VAYEVVESYLVSKSGDPQKCEDFIANGTAWAVVCDGATDKSGLDFHGETGGRLVARIVGETVASARSGETASDLVERINSAVRDALGPRVADLSVNDLPTCSFVAFDKGTGRVVRVGDVSWRTAAREFVGGKRIDEIHSDMRSAYLRMMMLEGAEREELLERDPGRAVILPGLRLQGFLRNNEHADDLGFGAIDGRPVPSRYVETWLLDGEREIAIASDGYPRILMSLDENEQYLDQDLLDDPLRIGKHRTTKGVRPGHVSFDDRAFVRLRETS